MNESGLKALASGLGPPPHSASTSCHITISRHGKGQIEICVVEKGSAESPVELSLTVSKAGNVKATGSRMDSPVTGGDHTLALSSLQIVHTKPLAIPPVTESHRLTAYTRHL